MAGLYAGTALGARGRGRACGEREREFCQARWEVEHGFLPRPFAASAAAPASTGPGHVSCFSLLIRRPCATDVATCAVGERIRSAPEDDVNVAQQPWQLIQAKQYAEAADAYSRSFAEGGGMIALRGRATALLLSGRPAEARADFARVIEETEPGHRGSGDYLRLGTCHWYLGRPAEAVALWRQGLSAPHTDAAGGVVCPVFLLYAGARLGDTAVRAEAERLLRNRWREHRRRVARDHASTARQAHEDFVHPGLYSWPGALVPFLVGAMGVGELDEAASRTSSDVLRARWQCQADFAIAVRALLESDTGGFRSRMSRSAVCPHGELEREFYQARWEVEHGFPPRPFAASAAAPGAAPDPSA